MNNFTPRAQQVLALARKEADRFNHNYVGTEHLLLGLIKLGQGVAVNVLQKLGLDLDTVRIEVEKQVGSGPDTKMSGNIPYTPRVKKVLALAGKEAKALNHSYVGTEHILLGLLREGDGVAARVLKTLDVDIERTRNEVLNLLSMLRLGVDLGLMPEEYRATIDELFIRTQPAHLQKDFERKLTTEERDGLRSDLLRERLKQVPEPDTKSLALGKPDADKKK